MPIPRSSNLPPLLPRPAAGTQTSNRHGNVVSTRTVPAPPPAPAPSTAPTSDRWGHVISGPVTTVPPRPTEPSGPVTTVPPRAPPAEPTGPVNTVPVDPSRPVDTVPTDDGRRPNMPPVRPNPPPGTQTSDRWGNVISTRPVPSPAAPVRTTPSAPTSDRWGNIVDWK